jgi:GNAT superfamily N-acetyltransferase
MEPLDEFKLPGPTFANLELREADPGDQDFLYLLYSSTRDDLSGIGLPPPQLDALIRMQFKAQSDDYRTNYPSARNYIISLRGDRVGRYLVERRADEVVGIDLSILPEFRGKGIGGAVLQGLINETIGSGVPFIIHVAKLNPARRLYERLGGRITGDTGTHFRMEWHPAENLTLPTRPT